MRHIPKRTERRCEGEKCSVENGKEKRLGLSVSKCWCWSFGLDYRLIRSWVWLIQDQLWLLFGCCTRSPCYISLGSAWLAYLLKAWSYQGVEQWIFQYFGKSIWANHSHTMRPRRVSKQSWHIAPFALIQAFFEWKIPGTRNFAMLVVSEYRLADHLHLAWEVPNIRFIMYTSCPLITKALPKHCWESMTGVGVTMASRTFWASWNLCTWGGLWWLTGWMSRLMAWNNMKAMTHLSMMFKLRNRNYYNWQVIGIHWSSIQRQVDYDHDCGW